MAKEKATPAKAGSKGEPGKYVCIDCGYEFELSSRDKELKKCPMCACEEYNCFPMVAMRPDIKTPEDAMNPPKKREYLKK
jgi:rubrerythrin